MTKVFTSHAVSVDGYLSGHGPDEAVGNGLGDAPMLFNWYFHGDTPSKVFDGFRLSGASARVFDALAGRIGATICGRTTYEHSSHFAGGGPHPNAPLIVLSSRPVPELSGSQQHATTLDEALSLARAVAGDLDIGLMGGGLATSALAAGAVDEVILHQVPILLGGGHPFFRALPAHIKLNLLEAVPAPGVTHLHYEVTR